MIYHEDLNEIGESLAKLDTQVISPGPELREIVHQYLVLNGDPGRDSNWYILPDNYTHLIFYLFDRGNTITPSWTVVGPRSKHKIINRQHRLFTFICSFKPGGLRSLVDIPLNEIKDLTTDSQYILRNYQPAIFEQLTTHALHLDIAKFVNTLEEFLISSPATSGINPAVHGFYEEILRKPYRLLAEVSKGLGYSDRQMRNLVERDIGHSPKLVQQIERFTESLRLRKSDENWASIAQASGYYDQSHMIAEYRKLVGTSPERLLS